VAGGQKNQVEQVVKLNTKGYVEGQRKIREESTRTTNQVNKDLHNAGKAFNDYTNQVKKHSASLVGSIMDAGKSFAKYLGRGALVGGATAGASFLHSQMKQAVSTGLDFGRSLAQIASRADLTQDRVKKLRRELFELGKTGANLSSLPGAVEELYGATGDIDKATGLMNPIAKVAAMGGGDATLVAKFVKEQLKGENRKLDKGNVESLLQGLVLTMRGGDFQSMEEAMAAYAGVGGTAKKRTGLSDRELAAAMGSATKAGQDREASVAGMQALIKKAAEGFHGSAALEGILGTGLLDKSGKFDISKLGAASQRYQKSGFKDADMVKLLSESGLGDKEAEGVVSILKDFKSVQAGFERTMKDQKTLAQAHAETTNNLSDALTKTRNDIMGGVDQILSPLEGVASKAVRGDLRGAMKGTPGALGDSLKGIADHPLLVAGALGTLAGGGKLVSKLGMFGGETLKGVAKGAALEKAGVDSVYVVNADEIGRAVSVGGIGTTAGGMLGGAKGALGKAAGLLKFAPHAAAAGAGIAAGSALNDAYEGYVQSNPDGAVGKADARLTEAIQSLAQAVGLIPAAVEGRKERIEIHSADPAFKAIPKSTDLTTKSRGP
jgi:hypothetical protein